MTENRVYLREVADRGGAFRKLGRRLRRQRPGVGFWSEDGKTIYFNAGVKVTNQLLALDIDARTRSGRSPMSGPPSRVNRDDDTGVILISYSDPADAAHGLHRVRASIDVTDRTAWVQLVDVNPQVREIALGEEVEVELDVHRRQDGGRRPRLSGGLPRRARGIP